MINPLSLSLSPSLPLSLPRSYFFIFSPMAITVFDACKKRKRSPKIYTIYDSATPSTFMEVSGPFRDNIRSFLNTCSEIETYNVSGNRVWCTLLVSEASGVVFPLYTVEEDVRSSPQPLCDSCRCVGWGHHYVSKRRYHLIIPRDDKWNKPLTKESLELTSHLLHGVIHCNGFGHLLCINGLGMGSNYLSGDEIMDVWDRICTTLQTRKISLDDVSRKRSMELRLLHGVAYSRPWFGKWGYKFCHGSFGITEDKYKRAIQILSCLELDKIIHDFSGTDQGKVIQQVIHCYGEASETHLVTLADLLQFMLAFKSKAPIERKTAMALVAISQDSSTSTISQGKTVDTESFAADLDFGCAPMREDMNTTLQHQSAAGKKPLGSNSFASFAMRFGSRWSARRLEGAAKVVFNALKECKTSMSRQELRDSVRVHIGDTGLIDFLLKHINRVQMGDHIINRCINPVTKMLEFSLLKVANEEEETEKRRKPHSSDWVSIKTGLDAYDDIFCLYRNVLLSYPDDDLLNWASGVIMDSKHFVKEWHLSMGTEDPNKYLRIFCQVLPSYEELVADFTRPLPPGELVVVPHTITVGELKSAMQHALRDTYCIMECFKVTEMITSELQKKKDLEVLTRGDVHILVRGHGLDLASELRYEGGFDNWTVDCRCGAKDDDGERMVACDGCKVWQHTRCNYMEDDDAVPRIFLCSKCIEIKAKNKKRLVVDNNSNFSLNLTSKKSNRSDRKVL